MSEKIKKDARKRFYSIGTLIYNKKINLAKSEIIKFIDDYPNDIGGYIYYIDILYMKGDYELALKISSNYLDNDIIKYKYAKINKKLGNFQEAKKIFLELYEANNNVTALINYINILVKEGDFSLAYQYLLNLDTNTLSKKNEKHLKILRRYIYKSIYPELVDILKNDTNLEYNDLQIIDYNEEYAKEKIMLLNESQNKYVFSSDINIEELFDNIKKLIVDKKYYDFNSFDKYIIHIPNVGKVNNISTDYLTVLTNINTKNIVNMFPCENYDENVIEYYNNEYENNSKKEYKKINAIDKFNRKYGFK